MVEPLTPKGELKRQLNNKLCSFTLLCLHFYFSVMSFDNIITQAQTQSRSLSRWFGGEEWLSPPAPKGELRRQLNNKLSSFTLLCLYFYFSVMSFVECQLHCLLQKLKPYRELFCTYCYSRFIMFL